MDYVTLVYLYKCDAYLQRIRRYVWVKFQHKVFTTKEKKDWTVPIISETYFKFEGKKCIWIWNNYFYHFRAMCSIILLFFVVQKVSFTLYWPLNKKCKSYKRWFFYFLTCKLISHKFTNTIQITIDYTMNSALSDTIKSQAKGSKMTTVNISQMSVWMWLYLRERGQDRVTKLTKKVQLDVYF